MRLKGKGKFVGGLVLAAGFALTGVVGVSAQQGQGEGGGEGRAERPWGHKEGRGGGRRGGFGRFADLNLSDAQQEQMRQIQERYHATFKAQRENRGEERRDFDPLSGTFDEGAVRAAAQARANAQVEREVAQARMMFEMYNVLTAEQKARLQAARQQREQRRQERRNRRGAGQGQVELQ
ncbi:MAG TPA: Spy/CpxP family protein refolding chaperone [Pyrinomonadaceae bacterium]|nr:Spy/CpxP family protein refolding chaperone [Pyrinomonadaceae bacterium]